MMGSGNQLQVMKKRPNRIVFTIRPMHACMPVSVQVVVIPIPGAWKVLLKELHIYTYITVVPDTELRLIA